MSRAEKKEQTREEKIRNGEEKTKPDTKERKPGQREKSLNQPAYHAGIFAPEASGRDGRRSALEYHPCGYGFSRHAAAVMIAATRQALDAARLMAAITADAGVRHRLSARLTAAVRPASTGRNRTHKGRAQRRPTATGFLR